MSLSERPVSWSEALPLGFRWTLQESAKRFPPVCSLPLHSCHAYPVVGAYFEPPGGRSDVNCARSTSTPARRRGAVVLRLHRERAAPVTRAHLPSDLSRRPQHLPTIGRRSGRNTARRSAPQILLAEAPRSRPRRAMSATRAGRSPPVGEWRRGRSRQGVEVARNRHWRPRPLRPELHEWRPDALCAWRGRHMSHQRAPRRGEFEHTFGSKAARTKQ